MKYSIPKLRGLGGSTGACLDGSSATNATSGRNECDTGTGASGACMAGETPGSSACVPGDDNAELCRFGGAAGFPQDCTGGGTFFSVPCSQGSAPG